MNPLEITVAVISLAFLLAGWILLYLLGLHTGGALALFGASICAFALILTLGVFRLRARIAALEKQWHARQ